MTEYPALKIALRHWGDLAIPLLKETRFDRYQIRDPRWQRDPDGVFREGGRVIDVWDHAGWDRLFNLPEWQAVLDILHADERLSRQVDTLVGSAYGGVHVEARSVGWRVLPCLIKAAPAAPLPSTPADQACQSGVHAGAVQDSRRNVCVHRFGDRLTSATRLPDLTPASDLLI
jgi:hypothetical protein